MLLIIAFGIYAIITKRVSITSKWTLTGDHARNFGIATILMVIPVTAVSRTVLPRLFPATWLRDPIAEG